MIMGWQSCLTLGKSDALLFYQQNSLDSYGTYARCGGDSVAKKELVFAFA